MITYNGEEDDSIPCKVFVNKDENEVMDDGTAINLDDVEEDHLGENK